MPRHEIHARQPTVEERPLVVKGPAGALSTAASGCGAIGCAAVPAFIAWMLGGMLGSALQTRIAALNPWNSVTYVPAFLAAGIVIVLFVWILRSEGTRSARVLGDPADPTIEVIEVWDPVAVEQEDRNPLYYLDIGGDRILLLSGQQFYTVPTFKDGRPWPEQETEEWQPPFLTSHFVLHRARASGNVLRIDVHGDPIAVSRTLPHGAIPTDDIESLVIVGRLDDLANAVVRALGGDEPTAGSTP
jgi:hypothetical protein